MSFHNPFIRLDSGREILPFDCGNEDLNNFLRDDAKPFLEKYLAVTYLLERKERTAIFFTLSNDKISATEFRRGERLFSNSFFNKLKGNFQRTKHRSDYPAVKIGRLGVDKEYQHHADHLGSMTIDFIKEWMITDNKTGCCFITVDAYASAVGFYLKNGFEFMGSKEQTAYSKWLKQPCTDSNHTPTFAMYFNLLRLHP